MRDNIKAHIMQYGAVSSYTYAATGDSTQYYNLDKVQAGNADTVAYYCNDTTVKMDHGITIVGWDDNYSKENFNDEHKPSKNGAYIVLNSYGEDAFNNGYLYISYEDVIIEKSLFGITNSNICIKAFSKYKKTETTSSEITDVTLNKKTASMEVGDILTLIATVTPENAANKTLIWTSNNEKVATVDQNGRVTAITVGTATITVSNEEKTINDTCIITVSEKQTEENQNKEENTILDSNIIIDTGNNDKNNTPEIDKITQFTPTETNKNNVDTTISPEAIPQAGINTVIIMVSVTILGIAVLITMIKLYQSRDIK